MIKKSFYPESFNLDIEPVTIIGQYSKGLDKQALDKRASAFTPEDLDFERKPGYQYLHIISTCGGETYGGNLNKDYFPYDYMTLPANEFAKEAKLDGGLKKYHKTYTDGKAAVYQEHQTKRNGVEPSGYIVKQATNDKMQRGELIIGLDEKKCAKALQRKASGKNIYFSMGCDVETDACFPIGTQVLTQFGYQPIEQIQVGDIVLSSQGNWKPVTTTFERTATSMVRINAMGLPIEMMCTSNHPIQILREKVLRSCIGTGATGLARRHTTDGHGKCKVCNRKLDLHGEWVAAGDIHSGDYLVVKIDDCAEKSTVGESFAYLCGMYVGDGSFASHTTGNVKGSNDRIKQISGINISASASPEDRPIIDKIADCYRRITGKNVSIQKESGGKNAYKVSLHDKYLTSRISELCGSGSRTKFIAKNILSWSKAEKGAFLAGYIDSDGHITKDGKVTRIVSVNRGLSLATYRLVLSLGIPGTCYIGSNGKDSAFGPATTSYAVGMRRLVPEITKHCCKAQRRPDAGTYKIDGSTVMIDSGYAYIRITDVRSFESDPITVYNLEVADDHTYNAEGMDVHNCSICHNRAHTREEYCDHIKHHLGKLMEDGTTVYMINDAPHFYDISIVATPADKAAFALKLLKEVAEDSTMKKSASLTPKYLPTSFATTSLNNKVAAALKLAKIEKEVPVEVTDDLEDACCDKDTEKALVDKLKKYDAAEALDALHRKGIMLDPEEFYDLIASDEEDPTEITDVTKDIKIDPEQVFYNIDDENDDFMDELKESSYDMEQLPDLNIMNMIEPFMSMLSSDPGALKNRSIKITIIKRAHKVSNKILKEASDYVSKDYAKYATAFVARNPDKALYALTKIRAASK